MKKILLFLVSLFLAVNVINAQDVQRTRKVGNEKFRELIENSHPSLHRLAPSMAPTADFTIFSENFNEPGLDLPAGWSTINSGDFCNWHMDASPVLPGYYSPPGSLNFNNGVNYGCDPGESGSIWGYVFSPLINLNGKPCNISFMYNEENECGSGGGGGGYAPIEECYWDRTYLVILDENMDLIGYSYFFGTTEWAPVSFSYDNPYQLQSFRFGFYFDTFDPYANNYYGPFIDDVRVTQSGVIPVSNWAILFGVVLIVLFTVYRFRRIA